MKVETGVFREQFPYVRVGVGSQPLVVLPGMTLDNKTPSALVARSYGQGFRRLADEYTLYIVQRPRGLSSGAGTKEIAAAYARLLSQELGRVRLMGLSTGGSIAQHVAVDQSDLVDGSSSSSAVPPSHRAAGRSACAGEIWRRTNNGGNCGGS